MLRSEIGLNLEDFYHPAFVAEDIRYPTSNVELSFLDFDPFQPEAIPFEGQGIYTSEQQINSLETSLGCGVGDPIGIGLALAIVYITKR
jgi:hypothetical protein